MNKNQFDLRRYLLGQHTKNSHQKGEAIVASISSGKGGVGKTTLALRTSLGLVEKGYRVLLIDGDIHLSNTVLKLGLPVVQDFLDYRKGEKSFEECVIRERGLDIFSGCQGEEELLSKTDGIEFLFQFVIEQQKKKYDFIIVDCPAGIGHLGLSLVKQASVPVFVINPDTASLTDTYSFIKVFLQRYGHRDIYIVSNKMLSREQSEKLADGLGRTAKKFLSLELKFVAAIPWISEMASIEGAHFFSAREKNGKLFRHQSFSQLEEFLVEQLFNPMEGRFCREQLRETQI